MVASSFESVLAYAIKTTARNVTHLWCFCKMLTQNYWLLALEATAVMPVLDVVAEANSAVNG